MRRRNKNVAVRMTEDEYAALMMRVAESGQTQQSFIINAVLGAKVSGREEVLELQKLSGRFADTNRQLRAWQLISTRWRIWQTVMGRYHSKNN